MLDRGHTNDEMLFIIVGFFADEIFLPCDRKTFMTILKLS